MVEFRLCATEDTTWVERMMEQLLIPVLVEAALAISYGGALVGMEILKSYWLHPSI